MKKYAIIVAGGSGTRMNSAVPKQFLDLAGTPILMHSIRAFHQYDESIKPIVVLPKEQINFWKDLCVKHNFAVKHQIAIGGETRFHSSLSGLNLVDDGSLVAIHDAVRPLVSQEVIHKTFQSAEKHGAAIPVVPLKDSIREVSNDNSEARIRSNYVLVQTPQSFRSVILKEAFAKGFNQNFTDDASVVEANGQKVALVDGDSNNIKITTPLDIKLAELFLQA